MGLPCLYRPSVGNHYIGLGIQDAAVQTAGGESREYDRMDGFDLCLGQHGDRQLGDHGHVESDSVEFSVDDLLGRLIGGLRDEDVFYLVLPGALGMPILSSRSFFSKALLRSFSPRAID
jgi:hypothetical protein